MSYYTFDLRSPDVTLGIISYAAGLSSVMTGKMSAQRPFLNLNWVTKHFAIEL